jgi:hypothetical protein
MQQSPVRLIIITGKAKIQLEPRPIVKKHKAGLRPMIPGLHEACLKKACVGDFNPAVQPIRIATGAAIPATKPFHQSEDAQGFPKATFRLNPGIDNKLRGGMGLLLWCVRTGELGRRVTWVLSHFHRGHERGRRRWGRRQKRRGQMRGRPEPGDIRTRSLPSIRCGSVPWR